MRLALRQRGQLLVAGVVLIVVIALMIVTLGFLYVSSERSSTLHGQSDAAYFVARSGLESAVFQFSQQGTLCDALAAANTNIPVDTGSFTITTPATSINRLYPTAAVSSTLSGAGIATTTPGIITVTVTAGAFASYAPHGRIRIENEEIDYSSASALATVCGTAPCFVAWRRGANGTTAATHAAGVAVFQDDQCLIRSTGTVGTSLRILEATVK
jgi:Tfp pilus assembly protein PilX